MQETDSRRAVSISEFARMFSISKDSVKRHARGGALRTIRLGGRRLVPASEISRVEREGLTVGVDFKARAANDND